LQADPERRAVTAVPNGKHISSQVDKGMPDSLAFQIILQPVGNVALGDTSQIDLRIRIGQCDGVPIHLYLPVVDVGDSFCQSSCVGDALILVVRKVPEAAGGGDGNIKHTSGDITVFK